MNWIVYLFGGGLIFFVGVGLIAIAVGLVSVLRAGWIAIAATIIALLGILLVAASAAPLSPWLYGVGFLTILWWLIAERTEHLEPQRAWTRAAATFLCAALVGLELPYQFTPSLPAGPRGALTIYGDSVTAGMGNERSPTWPKLVAAQYPIAVHDRSQPGATAASMAKVAAQESPVQGLVMIEIGGNDLLSGRSSADFEHDLETLLAAVSRPGGTVVMLELPLPPLCNHYGTVQRTLATRYGVALVPKRIFAAIISAEGLTTDTIHLSPGGHERMAKKMAEVLRLPAT